MPTGSFDLNPVPIAIANQALPIYVCLYTPGAENPYTILPNVRCLRIDCREQGEPPVARFQYLMDDLASANFGWPSQFEQLWPIDAQGNYNVLTDDRLVVLTTDPDGNPIVLFDGFAQVPQADVSAEHQTVTFGATNVAVRLWDDPILGRVQRNAWQTGTTDGSADVFVDLPCRFNPADSSVGVLGGYVGNSVGLTDFTVDTSVGSYPVFIEPYLEERSVADTNYWYISDAIAYLIATEPSPTDAANNPYVTYPTIATLGDILGTYAPPDDGVLNSGSAQQSNCKIRDYDAANKAVPDVFADLLGYGGFVMVFTTSADADGLPQTSLQVMRRDALASTAPKPIYLAATGATSLDLASNNATAFHLARDCNQVVNDWDIETGLKQYEITVFLAPGFQPAAGDDSPTNLPKWFKSNLTNVTDQSRRMYRWYVADECGDGFWNQNAAEWTVDSPLDFSVVFPPDPVTGVRQWVSRYRPGTKRIISKDASGNPLKATLELFTDQASQYPDIPGEAEAGNWTTVTSDWKLLDDRLGIEVTAENPNQWHTGQQMSFGGGNPAVGTIRGVTWAISPDPAEHHSILLRLTTVVESDQRIDAKATKRIASPTQFNRRRSADGMDHFQYCEIAPFSTYWATQKDMNGDGNDGTNPLICRDDTKAAVAHAQQLRAAHEFPTLAGSVTIPFITDYYKIGDRVQIVQGRNATFQINVGIDQGETPSYPWVNSFSWDFQGDRQQTVLQLSDRRGAPQGV